MDGEVGALGRRVGRIWRSEFFTQMGKGDSLVGRRERGWEWRILLTAELAGPGSVTMNGWWVAIFGRSFLMKTMCPGSGTCKQVDLGQVPPAVPVAKSTCALQVDSPSGVAQEPPAVTATQSTCAF